MTSATLNRGLNTKNPAGEFIGKFTLGIVLCDELLELHKVLLMQSFKVPAVHTLVVLSEMGSRSDLLYM